MAACSACGGELSGSPRFCPECGARVAAEGPVPREVRKTVTVLFSDLAGSTALGEQLDPEQLRAVMGRYFAAMQAVIERHGGTVEKFIGDAIMAVFGIPTVHEDDALRAVRAAADMRASLGDLNAELEAQGVRIRTRTGVNTGEVVAGVESDGATLVTGDAVNVAARLEQAAEPDEILIGETTQQLVRDAIRAEQVEPLALKGKSLPVPAHRLIEVTLGAAGHARRLDAPLVGRRRELSVLREAWQRVVEDRGPQLFTVLGAAGVGKSRLIAEFLTERSDATVMRGRCLPYGEGTYWPLAEALRGGAGIDETDSAEVARAKLSALVEGDRDSDVLAARLADAMGLAAGGAPQEELFWAVRRAFESIARRRPLIVVWDDLQWAEPTFIDLAEHLAEWSRDVPLLLVAMARPELLESRVGWGGGKLNATTILLEPLPAGASSELLEALPGGSVLPAELRGRIVEAAEGNPLFIEEMLAMLVDEGKLAPTESGWKADAHIARVPVPPTISALLAARLERLAPEERGVAERASVVGRVFEHGAVVELSPPLERSDITRRLLALVRKELVRPELEPGVAGEEAYRFRHLLIRDAAYAALPKAGRAALHEQFAGWLERVTGDRVGEYEEVIAHHLEQAYRYRIELGEAGESVEALGRRAGERLAAAARRAQARGDLAASMALHRQALALPGTPEHRITAAVRLARNLVDTGKWNEAEALLDDADQEARAIGDEGLAMHLLVVRGFLSLERDVKPPHERIEADARQALSVFEPLDDAIGMTRALDLLAFVSYYLNDPVSAGAAWRSAAVWAARANDPAELARILPLLPATATYEWETTSDAIAYIKALLAEYPGSPMLTVRGTAMLAWQYAERGDFEEAIAARDAALATLGELGLPWLASETTWNLADVDLLRGDWPGAERLAILGFEQAREHGYRHASFALEPLLTALHRQGRLDEARLLLEREANALGADDAVVELQHNVWRALFAAIDGDAASVSGFIDAVGRTAMVPDDRVRILMRVAEAHAILGSIGDAIATLEEVVQIAERKEMFARLGAARRRLAELREGAGNPPAAG